MLNKQYYVSNKQIRQTKQGKDFISLTLISVDDLKIAIEGKIWPEHIDKLKGLFNDGDVIKVLDSEKSSYNNVPQIAIKNLEVISKKKWGYTVDETKNIYNNILNFIDDNITHKQIQAITITTLKKYADIPFFFQSPAAKSHHHNYPGGLLQHTWELCNLAVSVKETNLYSVVDWDIVFSACILHDLGKVFDYSIDNGVIETTEIIGLTGHLVTTPMEIFNTVKDLGLENEKFIQNLLHAVVAHHGKKEFGSPQTPNTKEAWLVHLFDMISSQVS